jgi:hypothetical protein
MYLFRVVIRYPFTPEKVFYTPAETMGDAIRQVGYLVEPMPRMTEVAVTTLAVGEDIVWQAL